MKYLGYVAVALAAEQAAAAAVPWDLNTIATRSDYVQGRDKASKRSGVGNSFISGLLAKTGLNSNQVAQVEDVMEQQIQQTDAKARSSSKRSVAGSGFIASLLAKTGLNDNQVAQVEDVMEQKIQEVDAKTTSKRSNSAFISAILEKMGLSGAELEQVEAQVNQQLVESAGSVEKRAEVQLGAPLQQDSDGAIVIPTEEREAQTDDEEEEAAEMEAQIAAEEGMDQMQDGHRPVNVKAAGENALIRKDALVQEVRAWKATPEAKRAYEELAERNAAIDEALGLNKRWALCA